MQEDTETYMLLKDGEQTGPLTTAEIKTMLSDATISVSDFVWKEGMEEWLAISSIPSLAPRTEVPPKMTEAPPAEPTQAKPVLTFGEKLATSGKLAAAQAKLEKLKRMDLQSARQELGEAAFGVQFDAARLSESYAAVVKIGEQIEELRKTTPLADTAGAADKAKSYAKRGKQALDIESLTRQRKNAICDIGKEVESANNAPSNLSPIIEKINLIKIEIDKIEKEIAILSSRVSGLFAKPGRVLGVVAILVVAYMTWGFIAPRYENWKMNQEAKTQQKTADAEIAKYEAESKRLEMESLARQNQMEEEERISNAEREKERVAEGLARKEEQTARSIETRRAEEERRLEQEQRKMAQATAQADKEREKVEGEQKARVAAGEAQKERAALAGKLLGSVRLRPTLTLSSKLQRIGTAMEMRGENMEKIAQLQKNGDWLRLLGILDGRDLVEYPDARSIESEVAELQRSNFKILLKTSFQETNTDELYFITFPRRYSVVSSSNSWDRHPDGIGYLHDWSPEDGPVIVVSGNYETAGSYLRKTEQAYSQELRALDKKKDLGELSEDAFNASVDALRNRAHQTIAQWASGR